MSRVAWVRAAYERGKERKRVHTSYLEHSTFNELTFLSLIGTHSLPSYFRHSFESGEERTREKLLRGYLLGVTQRVRWGEIDKEVVLEYVSVLLKGYESNPHTFLLSHSSRRGGEEEERKSSAVINYLNEGLEVASQREGKGGK